MVIDNIICIAVNACSAPNKPGGISGILGSSDPTPSRKLTPITIKKEGADTDDSTSESTDHGAEEEHDEDEDETMSHGDLKLPV